MPSRSKCFKDNIDLKDEVTLFTENLPGISHTELYELTFLQIQKDFIPYIEISKPEENLSSSVLFKVVLDAVSKLVSEQPQSLVSVLYRIDLHESRLRREQQNIGPEEMVSFISEKILRKEAQKVWLRKTLS